MNVIATPPSQLRSEFRRNLVRHTSKSFDWDAFPGSRGYPELQRAQMRYIGAGGSPKVNEAGLLKPEHFTLSLIHKPVGNFAACHSHEVEESFLVISGVLTVGWERDGEVVEVRLGPKDMILNAADIGHGFRNDGVEPVLMSISVDAGHPLPPKYLYHPKNTAPDLARSFGAEPGKTLPHDAEGTHPLQQVMAPYVIRHAEQPLQRDAAGFLRQVYVGPGGVASTTCRKELLTVPAGLGVQPYARTVEDAFMVLEGSLTVGWEQDGEAVQATLGPRDLLLTPAGMPHWFRNAGLAPATVWHVVGEPGGETVAFRAA
jgi:mannose-6-phosphate isomerase-like protein (cupin superfamily)